MTEIHTRSGVVSGEIESSYSDESRAVEIEILLSIDIDELAREEYRDAMIELQNLGSVVSSQGISGAEKLEFIARLIRRIEECRRMRDNEERRAAQVAQQEEQMGQAMQNRTHRVLTPAPQRNFFMARTENVPRTDAAPQPSVEQSVTSNIVRAISENREEELISGEGHPNLRGLIANPDEDDLIMPDEVAEGLRQVLDMTPPASKPRPAPTGRRQLLLDEGANEGVENS